MLTKERGEQVSRGERDMEIEAGEVAIAWSYECEKYWSSFQACQAEFRYFTRLGGGIRHLVFSGLFQSYLDSGDCCALT